MCNKEEKVVAMVEEKLFKSQSEAFISIRKKIQEQMRKKGFIYNKELQVVEKNKNE